ncbi:hypothetical protein AURDEDRAFT_152096 [Auricularia subglabra TFB-10046 SS5]|uniref:C2H2-type domain-containing protein n=1 Tax=Auricularia subglabra (strain TFB-10046 / SS5) TaxID=717982 RepID=J0DDM9_AURST|nr:hypothetical protein AURDEDRAFT_152096 [Auricularia subglabra TFB-10046 SS5]
MALRCLWRGCQMSGPSPDDKTVFEHLAAAHNQAGGRFRCLWKGCTRESTVCGGQGGADHLITHTKYRPFVCGKATCKWAFARQDALQRHVSKVHAVVPEDVDGDCDPEHTCDVDVFEDIAPEPDRPLAHEQAEAEKRLERIIKLEAALAALEAKARVEDEAEHDEDWVFYR